MQTTNSTTHNYIAARDEYHRAYARFADAVKGGARESDIESLRVAVETAQDRLAAVADEITIHDRKQ